MGRHRRSAAAPAAEDHAAKVAGRNHGGHRRKRSGAPVRTGLVGVFAALAVGAVAVASGLVPGTDGFPLGGGADRVRAGSAPDLQAQGGSSTAPADRGTASAPTDRGTGRAEGPTRTGSPIGAPASPSKTSSKAPERAEPSPAAPSKSAAAGNGKSTAPTTEKSSAAPKTSAPATRSAAAPAPIAASASSAVLALVNQERGKVGCSPLTASASLASLAQDFSEDMAARSFFDHTDPDGRTPWDRASKAGVRGLAAENIAHGQADAQAVMDSWMNSDGHRANILNCDYKTLGVGVHYGSGGPWWTQDFGF
ncbi:membrane protein [Streptomyces gelaticus]|uniref:Membrane protein n=1 Tax=Streptomyces gelaticus TaxID=285446 RepID=A0ABQ2W6R2_9ACTN|nr:CAP domain-containing protein [Streptomyces gelaticus]GGV90644.1 membrane protein [Streptomyces gelaticus]